MSKFIEHLQPRFVVGGCVLVFYIYLFTYVLVSLFMFVYMKNKGFPGGASGKESTCQGRRPKRCEFGPWVGKIPWRRAWQPTPVFFLENPMDRGAWRAIVHGVAKSQTRLKRLSTHACT